MHFHRTGEFCLYPTLLAALRTLFLGCSSLKWAFVLITLIYKTESLGATNIGPQISQILHHTCSVWVAGPSKPAFSLPLETSLFPSASPLSLSPCCNNYHHDKCILLNWIPGKLSTINTCGCPSSSSASSCSTSFWVSSNSPSPILQASHSIFRAKANIIAVHV